MPSDGAGKNPSTAGVAASNDNFGIGAGGKGRGVAIPVVRKHQTWPHQRDNLAQPCKVA